MNEKAQSTNYAVRIFEPKDAGGALVFTFIPNGPGEENGVHRGTNGHGLMCIVCANIATAWYTSEKINQKPYQWSRHVTPCAFFSASYRGNGDRPATSLPQLRRSNTHTNSTGRGTRTTIDTDRSYAACQPGRKRRLLPAYRKAQ